MTHPFHAPNTGKIPINHYGGEVLKFHGVS